MISSNYLFFPCVIAPNCHQSLLRKCVGARENFGYLIEINYFQLIFWGY